MHNILLCWIFYFLDDVTSNIIKSTQSTDNCKSYEKHVDDVGLAQPIFIHNDYKTIKKSSDIDKLFMENFDVLGKIKYFVTLIYFYIFIIIINFFIGDNISTSNVTTPTKEINNPEPLRKNEVHLGPSHSRKYYLLSYLKCRYQYIIFNILFFR